MVVNESAISVRLAIVELAFIDLTRNHAVSTDAMVLIMLVNLTEIFIKTILVGEFHHTEAVIDLHLTSVDPSLERNFLQSVPFVGTGLIT